MYNLPKGIRIPNFEEYPKGTNVDEISTKREKSNIIRGYKIRKVEKETYNFYAEINIDYVDIWKSFNTLASGLINNEGAYGIIGFKDENPYMSEYFTKDKILDIFSKYCYELSNDGFIQFGIASNTEKEFNEVYVSNYKYFRIWGKNEMKFKDIMKQLDILEIDTLNFIDEFPVVSEALQDEKYKHHSIVIDEIKDKLK